ncbi:unnamed protein product [Cylicostephanus goldi]|uniref:Uncharacterized protein n=1 Tax=Cylicostephanus goldi TaxID=71465 RepID=A0A3P6S0N5_CYLGO|nr:unnamed protein product [Cylicostephanus goldi]
MLVTIALSTSYPMDLPIPNNRQEQATTHPTPF